MKALVIRFSSLGDLILTTGPILQTHNHLENIQLDILTSEMGQDIFINNKNINKIWCLPKNSSLIKTISFMKSLSTYDVIIDLHANLKSRLFCTLHGGKVFRIKKQSYQRRQFVKNRKFAEQLNQHVTQKYYDVFQRAFDLPQLTTERLKPSFTANNLCFSLNNFNFENGVVVHPYASQNNKEWPYFEKLINELTDLGHSVIVVGQTSTEPLSIQNEKVLNLTNKTSLNEMAAILSKSKALVSTDSGPMHLGVALNIPTLALFGPTTKEFGFYPVFQNSSVIEKDTLTCRPCHVHGGNSCPLSHFKCMRDIHVDEVIAQLQAKILV